MSEIEGRYGVCETSIEIDHKGRIFAYSHNTQDDTDAVVIFNEGNIGEESVRRLRALCDEWLSALDDSAVKP